MPRITHFEIQAEDPKRAMAFYTGLFGWSFEQWGTNDYWMITTGPKEEIGINGGLLPRKGSTWGDFVNAYVCTAGVDDLDATLVKLVELGGAVVVQKNEIPGMGWLAYAKDTEGNIFGMMQPMMKA